MRSKKTHELHEVDIVSANERRRKCKTVAKCQRSGSRVGKTPFR